MDNKCTLYCRNFPDDFSDSDLSNIFAKYGSIVKIFIHNTGSYSMVQYDNMSSCTNAIRGEHCIPPLNLYVNFARTQQTDRKETNESSPPRGNTKYSPRNYQNDNMTSPKQFKPKNQSFERIESNDQMPSPPLNNSFNGIQNLTLPKPKKINAVYKEDIIYMDRYNNILPILKDDKNELYVPLSCIEGLKRYVKKTPICGTDEVELNLDEYTLLDDSVSKQDDDARSQHSNNSGGASRHVQFGENLSDIKIQVDVSGASMNNTGEPVFKSIVEASNTNVPRYPFFNKQKQAHLQKPQFGGHTNENRQFNNHRSEAPENRSTTSEYSNDNRRPDLQANDENRPYENRRSDSKQFDGKRNQNQPFNRNKPPHQESNQVNHNQNRDFNKLKRNSMNFPKPNEEDSNQVNQNRDFNKLKRNMNMPKQNDEESNQVNQNRDFNKIKRNMNLSKQNDDESNQGNQNPKRDFNKLKRNMNMPKQNEDGHMRRPSYPHRKPENKPIENDADDWDTVSEAPTTVAAPLSTLIPSLASNNKKHPSLNNDALNMDTPPSTSYAKTPEQSTENKKRYSAGERLKCLKKPVVEYKSINLPARKFTKVKIISVVNETDAWVQLSDHSDFISETLVFDAIIEAREAQSTTPEVGKLCLSNFDDYWYRAVVLQTAPKLRVRYIDFGNEQDEPAAGLKIISKKLADFPAHAIHIRLSDGSPCTLIENELCTIKPIKKDKDVYIVHVQNGMYNKEETDMADNFELPPKPIDAAPVNVLTGLQALFLSLIHKGSNGFLEKVATLSKTRFVAYFIPVDLTDLYREVIDTAPSSTTPKFPLKAHDLAIAFTDGSWSRAFILSVEQNSYRVAFIDYGIIKVVPEVKPLPEKMAKLPQFACVCQVDNHTEITGDLTFTTTSISSGSFTIAVTINNTRFSNIVVTPWDPIKEDAITACIEPTPVSPPIQAPVTKPPTPTPITTKPTKISELQLHNGDAARLLYISGNNLYIRTKEAHTVFKVIDENMKQYLTSGKPVASNVVIGQFVAAEYEGGWYRAAITEIKTNIATVLFIDYGNEEDKLISTFKMLDDNIRDLPCTLIKVKLRDFVNTNFTVESLRYLLSLIETTVFKVQFTSLDDGIDLISVKDGVNISDHLNKIVNKATATNPKVESTPTPIEVAACIENKPESIQYTVPVASDPRVLYIPVQPLPMGKQCVQFLSYGNWDLKSIIVCLNDPDTLHKVNVDLQKKILHYCTNIAPPEPYRPIMEEYILVRHNNMWFRALCISDLNDDYIYCFFIDIGISENIHVPDIRRIPTELCSTPSIANFAIFHGISEMTEELIANLEDLFLLKEKYEVNILDCNDAGFYEMSFPVILKVLQQKHLI